MQMKQAAVMEIYSDLKIQFERLTAQVNMLADQLTDNQCSKREIYDLKEITDRENFQLRERVSILEAHTQSIPKPQRQPKVGEFVLYHSCSPTIYARVDAIDEANPMRVTLSIDAENKIGNIPHGVGVCCWSFID